MNDKARRLLPPMAALHAFAAAARAESFSRAADAIGLTQGAAAGKSRSSNIGSNGRYSTVMAGASR